MAVGLTHMALAIGHDNFIGDVLLRRDDSLAALRENISMRGPRRPRAFLRWNNVIFANHLAYMLMTSEM